MKEIESNYILSRDGLKLNYSMRMVETPVAIVCIFHGHGEHLGRYNHVVDYLNSKQISCISLDFRGHGLSEGQRGHMQSLEYVLDDMEELLKVARLYDLESPLFLFGHSFGGCMVLNYVLRRPTMELTGFIASSPWLKLAFDPPSWKVKLGNMMTRIVPKFSQPTQLDATKLSRKLGVAEAYSSDQLVHDKMSARFFSEVSQAGSYVLSEDANLRLKGLVYHGSGDEIISYEASKEFADKAAGVSFKTFEGFYHEPHNDIGQESVLENVFAWISQAIKS